MKTKIRNQWVCGIVKKYRLGQFKNVKNRDFSYFWKKESISLAFLLNYLLIHYLKKTLISLRNVPKLIHPFLSSKKQASIFLHTPLWLLPYFHCIHASKSILFSFLMTKYIYVSFIWQQHFWKKCCRLHLNMPHFVNLYAKIARWLHKNSPQ